MAQNLSPHRARVTTSSFLPSGIGSCQLGQASHCLMAHSSCQDTTVIGSNPGLELQTWKAATARVELMISTSSPCFLMFKYENYEEVRSTHLSLVILCRKFVHITQQFLAKLFCWCPALLWHLPQENTPTSSVATLFWVKFVPGNFVPNNYVPMQCGSK